MWRDLDAGHYVPAGECGFGLLFNETNVHGQCKKCNRFQGGRQALYTFALDRKFGTGFGESLWSKKWGINKEWSKLEYEDKIIEYKDKILALDKLL